MNPYCTIACKYIGKDHWVCGQICEPGLIVLAMALVLGAVSFCILFAAVYWLAEKVKKCEKQKRKSEKVKKK